MSRTAGLACAALLLAGAPAAATPAPTDHDAVGGLRIGDAFAPASTGAGWTVSDDSAASADCARLSDGPLPPGVGMMVLDGRIARFEIGLSGGAGDGPPPAVPFGLQLGMSLGEAGSRFPAEVEVAAHKYAWPPGLYLTWQDPLRDRGVRAELPDGRTVEVILWGTALAVTLTEGCL